MFEWFGSAKNFAKKNFPVVTGERFCKFVNLGFNQSLKFRLEPSACNCVAVHVAVGDFDVVKRLGVREPIARQFCAEKVLKFLAIRIQAE